MKPAKNIDTRALQVFLAVAGSETMTEAGERLGVSQSAVSQAIKQLESHVGADLVIRSSRPIRLTASGKIIANYARRTLDDMQKTLAAVNMASNNVFSHLSLGIIDSFAAVASRQIVEQIKPFADKLSIRTGISGSLSKSMLDHELDVLVTTEPLEEHPELSRYPILRDPFVLIAPVQCKSAFTPETLAVDLPFVHYGRNLRIGKLVDLIARRLDIRLQTQYEVDNTQTLLRFVSAGHGWSITTALCVVRHTDLLEKVKVVPLSAGAHARYLSLLSHGEELGELPERLVRICQVIFAEDIRPRLAAIAPWLNDQAYTIDDVPAI